MTLNALPTYPSLGSYVLKLHRDSAPEQGLLRGRLEHIASGEAFEFTDAEALVAGLARHAAAQRLQAAAAATPLHSTAAHARGTPP